MYQIDKSTAAATQPAASAVGTAGFFTDGNPAAGVAATIVPAEWLNAVMMELVNLVSASGLTPNKSNFTQIAQAVQLLAAGRLLNIQTFTSSGTYIPTPGTKSVIIRVQAPGGGTGGVPAQAAGAVGLSPASAAGTYAEALFTGGFSSLAVTIGAIGAAGTAGANAGGTGGTTSVGSLISCPGGTGGVAGGSSTGFNVIPGAGAPAAATITGAAKVLANIAGAAGTHGTGAASGGGGAAGFGGSSPLGTGGAGGIGGSTMQGKAPSGYGAGAGGTYVGPSSAAAPGTAGAPAEVIFYELG